MEQVDSPAEWWAEVEVETLCDTVAVLEAKKLLDTLDTPAKQVTLDRIHCMSSVPFSVYLLSLKTESFDNAILQLWLAYD